MRGIKFRLWEKELKAMITVDNSDQFLISLDGRVFDTGFTFSHQAEYCKGMVPMLFTGLDKNGAEVYDGDVIKGRLDLGGKLKRFIGVVDVNLPYVTVKGVKQYSWKVCHSISDVRLFEVIGNIYENPELLTNK